jgi:transposase
MEPIRRSRIMARKRGVRGSTFKAKVALAAMKGDKTLAELSGQFGVHSTQISTWKQRLLDGASDLFEDRRRSRRGEETNVDALYEQIGRLNMEVEWLKKKAAQFD